MIAAVTLITQCWLYSAPIVFTSLFFKLLGSVLLSHNWRRCKSGTKNILYLNFHNWVVFMRLMMRSRCCESLKDTNASRVILRSLTVSPSQRRFSWCLRLRPLTMLIAWCVEITDWQCRLKHWVRPFNDFTSDFIFFFFALPSGTS